MKKKFSKSWKSSTQTRKKRKYQANAPLHLRHQMMKANLSKELRKKYGMRSIPVRKGDTVKIMVGKNKKKTGKVKNVDKKTMVITIEKIQNQKKDGTKIDVKFNPSNLQITEMNAEDKRRIRIKKENKEEKKDAPKKK